MKLGIGTILAILESLLFVTGAVFCALVMVIPTNPIWALTAGIVCGLTGAIIWSCSLFVRTVKKVHTKVQNKKVTPEEIAKKILTDEDLAEETYELHRNENYTDDIDDIIPDLPNTTPEQPTSSN